MIRNSFLKKKVPFFFLFCSAFLFGEEKETARIKEKCYGVIGEVIREDGEELRVFSERIEKLFPSAQGREKGLLRETKACVHALSEPFSSEKERYLSFLEHARKGLNLAQGSGEIDSYCRSFLERLAYRSFRPDFNKTGECYRALFSLLPPEYLRITREELNPYQLGSDLTAGLESDSFGNKWRAKALSFSERFPFGKSDPVKNNLRSLMTERVIGGRKVAILRMSNPFYGRNGSPMIDPLFTAYLREADRKGEKHLYVNNQNASSEGSSLERKRSRLLHALGEKEPNLTVISLPHDSSFYRQPNYGFMSADFFIREFISHLNRNEEGFSIPPSCKGKDFERDMTLLLRKIHREFFAQRCFLSRIDRTRFLDIAYAGIVLHFLTGGEYSSVNWTCFHGIDRAMGSATLFLTLLEDLPISEIIYFQCAPAVFYRGRAPRKKRLERSFSALRTITETPFEKPFL